MPDAMRDPDMPAIVTDIERVRRSGSAAENHELRPFIRGLGPPSVAPFQ